MAKIDGRFVKFDSDTIEKNVSNEIAVKIKSGSVMSKTAEGLQVNVNDSSTSLTNLWTSTKVSNELSAKASVSYVDNAIAGMKWKDPVLDFKTQAQLDALSPTTGDRYIITDGANINKIAQYGESSWSYSIPIDNWTLVKKTDDKVYTYDGDSASAFKWLYKGGLQQIEVTVVEKHVLTAQNITDKSITLTYTPVNANNVVVDVKGGCIQDNGTDFSVNAGTKAVSWAGLGLDGILATNDVLIITYQRTLS